MKYLKLEIYICCIDLLSTKLRTKDLYVMTKKNVSWRGGGFFSLSDGYTSHRQTNKQKPRYKHIDKQTSFIKVVSIFVVCKFRVNTILSLHLFFFNLFSHQSID